MQNFSADIPRSLYEADEVLTKYGRWALARGGARTCGSAEGMYRAPAGEALEARRTPSAPLDARQRVAAQRALAKTPEPLRRVLAALYVPSRSIGLQIRLLGISAALCRDRHEQGLAVWWGLYQALIDEREEMCQDAAT